MRPQKGQGPSHDTHFWCSNGGHWILKELAEIVKGRPFCPLDKAWLRTTTRNRENKHEERVTRY